MEYNDKEIVQTLKNHIEAEDCVSCESFGKCNEFLLTKNTLDLINRQQAEIERLNTENNKNFDKWNILEERTKKRYAELYEEAKSVVRAKAVKEFAENLKQDIKNHRFEMNMNGLKGTHRTDEMTYETIIEYIDNLVKEMIGDAE